MRYSVTDFRRAIAAAGANPAGIAAELSCTRGTVYRYLTKYPELKAEFERQRGVVVDERSQYPKEVFEAAIAQSHGVKAAVAAAVGCHRNTVDNALERWPDLKILLDAQRSKLLGQATSALAADVGNPESKGHQAAYLFVLRTLGKEEGFTERQEVTGADGAGLFELPPDVREIIVRSGLDVRAVMEHFVTMARALPATT